jgi:energy-coupling factor transporter ATP-binding protein EcfA2
LKNLCLIELDNLLMANGRSLKDYKSMPPAIHSDVLAYENKLIADELSYDKVELAALHAKLISMLTEEQHNVYQDIMNSVLCGDGQFYFLYGYGGTGKTFLWKTLSAAIRSQGKIVLNVASSGIASLLLPNGKTAHSTFSIPLVINQKSTCNITQQCPRAKLLRETSLFIWDEAPMMNKFCFEAFDRTMRDIMRVEDEENLKKPFGGKVVVLGGDFRQILPVVRNGSRRDIIKATVSSSKIWRTVKVLKLTQNMRLKGDATNQTYEEIKQFADWILNIGDGVEQADENGEVEIQIPKDLCILEGTNPLLDLIDFVYPNIAENIQNANFFEDQAVLAPTLEVVEQVNDFVLSLIPGDSREYLSADTHASQMKIMMFRVTGLPQSF